MSLDQLAAALEERLSGAVDRDALIAELTTYRLGGPAAILVRVADEAALAVVADCLTCGQVPVLVVGRGSNLLVADRGFEGLAVVLGDAFDTVELDAHEGRVRAGGAVALPVLARRAAAAGLSGLEFFVGIPGSVGGAVKMNAGGHGRETKDVLETAWSMDLHGEPRGIAPRSAAALDFGYRTSALSASDVVTAAEFVVTPDDPGACEERVAEIVRWRRANQPGGANAGSVFRNPPGNSAGRLIDEAGLKGLRVGGASVSEKHANFFQAEPGATAADVRGLVEDVRRKVEKATGVVLQPELRFVGFGDTEERSAR
jgi:UDP-N-acetylmuramate dehydrogenase